MSTVKKGVLIQAGEWAKHLRRWGKRKFWRKHRGVERRIVQSETQQGD